jgi:hypothetical protein
MATGLPPHTHVRPDLHLLVWKPEGVLDEKAVTKIVGFIGEQEALSGANELRFIDATALTEVDLNFRYVFHVALYRRLSRMGRPSIKTACLVKNEAYAHYFKLHALLTDHSPINVKLFKEKKAAAKWLRLSVEALEMS